MRWIVVILDPVERFLGGLDHVPRVRVLAALKLLQEHGPQLGRPHVGTLKASRHKNMKELRVQYGEQIIRVLFAFDRQRQAVLLTGADKVAYGVTDFYEDFIPIADDLFDTHLKGAGEAAAESKAKPARKPKSVSPKPSKGS